MSTVAANMILGERPEPFLRYSLRSTKFVDEYVIVNTGSENNQNIKIALEEIPTAKIIQFTGEFSFSAARNLALENTESGWIIWIDADECHFEAFEGLVRAFIREPQGDGIETGFYHFLLDMYHYQSIDPRVNVFRNDGKQWEGKVHEQIKPIQKVFSTPYRYHHYGYVKPQELVYENWRTYWDLNPDEKWKLHEKRNPRDIISDRVSVAKEYHGSYPEVIQSDLSTFPVKVKDFKLI